ncbi:MAG TPA: PAS domain S-box protein [Solirubrobacterales bacterium]|nr:PAS domain S-box protein [Solirubrobacterales bacterium]
METRWFDRDNARRTLPFAAAAVLGLLLALLPPTPPVLNIVLAAALVGAIGLCSLFCAWARPPAPLAVLPPLAFLLVVGLLRGDNGVGTGFGPLALLSVFWIALYGRRWQLGVVLGGAAVLFALPLAGIVGDGYSAGNLRYAATWLSVASLVGFTAQALVTRQRHQSRALVEQNAFLDAMFAAAGTLVTVVEPDGRVSRINPACEKLGGFTADEIDGHYFWDVLMEPEQARAMGQWWSALEPERRVGVAETPMVSRDGAEHTVHWTLDPLRGSAGEIVGFIATGLDVTEERAAQRALKEERDRFDSVLRASTEYAIIGTDAEGLITVFNGGAERMFGYTAEEMIGRQTPKIFHVPEEVAARAAEVGLEPGFEALTYHARRGRADRRDWTFVRADGSRFTVALTITAIEGPDGTPSGFIGIATDVSARRAAAAALAESEFRFRTLISNLPDTLISLYDSELRCIAVEGPTLDSRGLRPDEFVGRTIEETVPPDRAAQLVPAMEAALAGGTTSLEYESHRSDSIYEVEVVPYEREGETVGVFTISRDVTERKRFERELKHLAEYDTLSGLLNRRRFELELQRHLTHIARYGRTGALLLLDVDRFKAVNDTLGHARGDELIVAVARTLDEQLRGSDRAARLGGDEFAVLLPEAGREEAETVASKLVEAIREKALMPTGEPPRAVSISVGVAAFAGTDHLTPEGPLAEADLAMYEAKAAGGDGFRLHLPQTATAD